MEKCDLLIPYFPKELCKIIVSYCTDSLLKWNTLEPYNYYILEIRVEVHVHIRSWNFFRFREGMSGLSFAN
jgi:hypothetical protein